MNKGHIGGLLTALAVSKLMGCSYYKAKKELKKLFASKEIIELEDIGNLIYEFRKNKADGVGAKLDRYLDRMRWTF